MKDALKGNLVVGTLGFVEKNIVRAIFRCDVTKAFGVIKPLNAAFESTFDILA